MEILPTNRVRLIKNVPFSINYQDVVLFDNATDQQNYFNSLPYKEFDNITYTRNNGQIKVNANRETLLDYNYMYFQNTNYGTKIFYAFITDVIYINPNTSLIKFIVDEWQTWCFDLTFRPTFIERKHCKRWNSDGTPVINTVPEGLDYGTEYLVKDHEDYNNNLYWICFVTSLELNTSLLEVADVPTILTTFYLPIYKTTSNVVTGGTFHVGSINASFPTPNDLLRQFRNNASLVNTLVSCFIVSEPPFEYNYLVNSDSLDVTITGKGGVAQIPNLDSNYHGAVFYGKQVPNRPSHSFSKYGSLKNYVTESKLLMYPYSYVQLVDGQGNNFIIKPEYLTTSTINVTTYTSAGLNSKQAHIVQDYRQQNVDLSACRWELQNGIINSMPNALTIVDDYSSAYLQGNKNTISTNISNVQLQISANNKIAQNNMNANLASVTAQSVGNILTGGISGGIAGAGKGGIGVGPGIASGVITNAISGVANYTSSYIQGRNYVENTELQGNVTEEKTIASAMAKIDDTENVADNVALQGGDVYFTYQNQYSGYCLVYKQISPEYITILEDYFQKYGYKVNIIEIPNLHTRQSWDYIRTVGCNVVGSINNDSLQKIRTIFNNGVTIWHTTDVGNYNLSNNEI